MNDNPRKLVDYLRSLTQETECLEFKEAREDFNYDKLGQYFSALSNEANLQGNDYGYLILGIEDKTHKVVGTSWKMGKHGELKEAIAKNVIGNITFSSVDEVVYSEGRVLLFKIPAAPQGIPVSWKGHYYGRKVVSRIFRTL